MIYEISTTQIPIALQNSCSLIIISADSSHALIRGNNIDQFTIINQYEDSAMNSVLSLPFWQQPCTNCEG